MTDKTNEPSMEELLASIREIIADDVRQTKTESPVKSSSIKSSSVKKNEKRIDDDVVLELTQKIEGPTAPTFGPSTEEERVRSRLRAEATTFGEEHFLDQGVEEFLGSATEPTSNTTESKHPFRSTFREDLHQAFRNSPPPSSPVQEPLLSEQTIAETVKALEGLNTIIGDPRLESPSARMGSKTLEDLMKEMLKPMLKTWLDAHLPSLVKWVVAEQVEKILQSRNR